jgi:nucleotide-binding universal stress UspA family protein
MPPITEGSRREEAMMARTVVVPLDGSAAAERALAPARELATRFHGSLLLFAPAGDDAQEVAAYLDRLAASIDDQAVTTVVHHGYESRALADTVHPIADAVVCMAPDLAAPDGTVLGTVAEDVIDRGEAPVMLVGPSFTSKRGMANVERGIIMCADGSAAASSAESVVVEWAKALDLEVHVLTVMPHTRQTVDGMPIDRILREVGNLAFRLERQGLTVRIVHLDDGLDPAFPITAYASSHPTALIAASSRGHRHEDRLHHVLGDTIVHIVRLAPVPVLVFQPRAATFHS